VPSAARRLRPLHVVLVGLAVLLLLTSIAPARAEPRAGYPPLPIALDRGFVGNLTAPTLAPGNSGTISFTVSDPLAAPLTSVRVDLGVYAFNGFPGNATSFVPVAGAPVLVTPSTSGPQANLSVGSVAPGHVYDGSVGIASASTTPSGTFAVRVSLAFNESGTAYYLASRGWFNASVWAAATELPNGSATLNLSVLGVSGVLPETAVLVRSSEFDWVLAGLLAATFLLVGAAAWVYFRRGGSRSGAR